MLGFISPIDILTSMSYLNPVVMDAIDSGKFQAQQPFPWINPQYFVRQDRYSELLQSIPDVARFNASFGMQRNHGQASHDRYILDYERGMELASQWRDFAEELCGDTYRDFICRLLNVSDVRFRFHWHFTPNGGEVSPHCDSRAKIGSHIFYLNTEDDGIGVRVAKLSSSMTRAVSADNAPAFEDFDAAYLAQTKDNRSLLFGRRGNSWHGVRRINCPANSYRKVFIVVFEKYRPLRIALKKTRRLLTGAELVTQKERLMY
ncbi:MAG: hypothetical protein IPG64_27220 [Haliea sp.]|nr:hypothetical protein [Haliea sp.]